MNTCSEFQQMPSMYLCNFDYLVSGKPQKYFHSYYETFAEKSILYKIENL